MRTGLTILSWALGLLACLPPAAAAPGQRAFDQSELIVPVNVISNTDQFGNVDGRGSLTEMATQLGLSEEEVDRIRLASGWVVCPGSQSNNAVVGSGSLVGSNMQVATVAHTFIDQYGQKREPLSDCYFLTQSVPPQKIFLDFDKDNFRLGNEGVREPGDPRDYAVVPLREPVKGATPFRFVRYEVRRGEWIIGLTAGQESPTRTFSRDVPVVQQCRVRDFRRTTGPVQYISDCDLSPLGSGGPILTRNSAGELVVRGIFTWTGKQHLNGQEYDTATGSFTAIISVLGEFADAVEAVRDSLPKDIPYLVVVGN